MVGVNGAPTGFDRDEASLLDFARQIRDSGARIVFVGLPFPRQERTIACLRAEVGSAWFVGVGVSFSFVSGELKRAPRVLQLTGLEWSHRLWQEPRRLGRRYILQGVPFALELFLSTLLARLASRSSPRTP